MNSPGSTCAKQLSCVAVIRWSSEPRWVAVFFLVYCPCVSRLVAPFVLGPAGHGPCVTFAASRVTRWPVLLSLSLWGSFSVGLPGCFVRGGAALLGCVGPLFSIAGRFLASRIWCFVRSCALWVPVEGGVWSRSSALRLLFGRTVSVRSLGIWIWSDLVALRSSCGVAVGGGGLRRCFVWPVGLSVRGELCLPSLPFFCLSVWLGCSVWVRWTVWLVLRVRPGRGAVVISACSIFIYLQTHLAHYVRWKYQSFVILYRFPPGGRGPAAPHFFPRWLGSQFPPTGEGAAARCGGRGRGMCGSRAAARCGECAGEVDDSEPGDAAAPVRSRVPSRATRRCRRDRGFRAGRRGGGTCRRQPTTDELHAATNWNSEARQHTYEE